MFQRTVGNDLQTSSRLFRSFIRQAERRVDIQLALYERVAGFLQVRAAYMVRGIENG
jgi:hypothetical protein